MADIAVSTFFNRCYVSDAKPKFFLPHQSLKIIVSFKNLTKTNLTLLKQDFYLVSLAVDNRTHYSHSQPVLMIQERKGWTRQKWLYSEFWKGSQTLSFQRSGGVGPDIRAGKWQLGGGAHCISCTSEVVALGFPDTNCQEISYLQSCSLYLTSNP